MGSDAEIIEAARRAGVEHVVLVSSITAQTHPHLGPARENLVVEQLLKDSGMAWTILRPTQFASNALWWAGTIREHETVRVPYADIGLPTIHPADIASVARAALTGPGHRERTYALTGPSGSRPGSRSRPSRRRWDGMCRSPGSAARRPTGQLAAILGDEGADAVLDLTGGDINDELQAVRDTVSEVTGAPARTFSQWISENAAAFRGTARP